MLALHQSMRSVLSLSFIVLSLSTGGCANWHLPFADDEGAGESDEAIVNIEQAQRFREAETERATQLIQEIERLQADLKTAEDALIEAESGLSASHTRADAVSALAVTRIQVDRAAARAPWRVQEIEAVRMKLEEAEHQVEEGRFGAALFFVYRARRLAESIHDEADVVRRDGKARLIQVAHVNLRTGPSTTEPILAVLTHGTPVFPQTDQGEWVLVQVSGGPVGWIHRRLVGRRVISDGPSPAALRP